MADYFSADQHGHFERHTVRRYCFILARSRVIRWIMYRTSPFRAKQDTSASRRGPVRPVGAYFLIRTGVPAQPYRSAFPVLKLSAAAEAAAAALKTPGPSHRRPEPSGSEAVKGRLPRGGVQALCARDIQTHAYHFCKCHKYNTFGLHDRNRSIPIRN